MTTTVVSGSDDPAVEGTRTGLIAVDQCRPRESPSRHALRHDQMHRKANRYPAVSSSERKFRLTGQDLDLIFGRKVAPPILAAAKWLPSPFRGGVSANVLERVDCGDFWVKRGRP